MHVVIRRYDIEPGIRAEVSRRLQEGFLPLIEKTPGFVGYYWAKANDGEMFSVGVFENEAGAEASNQIAADFVRLQMEDLTLHRRETISGDIILHGSR